MIKKRYGADNIGPTFGLEQPGVAWLLEKKNGERRTGYGATAFLAAASVGWSLGEVSSVVPMKEQP